MEIRAVGEQSNTRSDSPSLDRTSLGEREKFALGVGYGTFSSLIGETRDRTVEIQRSLERALEILGKLDAEAARQRQLDVLLSRVEALLPPQKRGEEARALQEELRQNISRASLASRLIRALEFCEAQPKMTAASLAEAMKLKPNTCSEYLAELERRGHLDKMEHGVYRIRPSGVVSRLSSDPSPAT